MHQMEGRYMRPSSFPLAEGDKANQKRQSTKPSQRIEENVKAVKPDVRNAVLADNLAADLLTMPRIGELQLPLRRSRHKPINFGKEVCNQGKQQTGATLLDVSIQCAVDLKCRCAIARTMADITSV
jgi:hypothetical protein